jgi:uncharacterized protein
VAALPPPVQDGAPVAREPGWYPDPWIWWATRWWNGQTWSGYAAEAMITEAPPPRPPTPVFPLRAGVTVVAVLAASLLAQKFALSPLMDAINLPVGIVATVGMTAVYLPSLLYCLYAARRWGQGDVLGSLGLQLKGRDIAIGFATWIGTLLALAIIRLLLISAGIPFASNVGGGGGRVGRDRSIFLISSLIAVVVAPFVEELVFRGLALRSFRSRLNVPAALLIQGILFGCAHADVRFGAGNIGLVIALSVAGISLGAIAAKCGRNGPNMIAHAFMNGFVFLILYASSH